MLRSFWLMFMLIGDVSKVANNCVSPVTSFDNYLFLFLAATLRYSVLQRKHNRCPYPRDRIPPDELQQLKSERSDARFAHIFLTHEELREPPHFPLVSLK